MLSGIGNKKDYSVFGWQERYRVAVGVAEALDYLHNGCAQAAIHRDVKSSNILLSDDFEAQVLYYIYSPCSISCCYLLIFFHLLSVIPVPYATCLFLQLSDFGLASWGSSSCHIICTDVAGTFG